jgi:hypothetical protein
MKEHEKYFATCKNTNAAKHMYMQQFIFVVANHRQKTSHNNEAMLAATQKGVAT